VRETIEVQLYIMTKWAIHSLYSRNWRN